MDTHAPLRSQREPGATALSPGRFYALAAAIVMGWIFGQVGWTTAHVFNATRFLLYDQGSYLYAVGRWQAGEALYRDFAWQYGPLALAWYRAFAAIGGNSPVTLVVASSLAFAIAWIITARLVVRVAGRVWGGVLAVGGLLPVMSPSGINAINAPHGAIEMLLFALIAATLSLKPSARSWSPWLLGGLAGLLHWVRFGPHAVALASIVIISAWQRWPQAGDRRNFFRETVQCVGRVLVGYALCVTPLVIWFFSALPAAGAREMLWPAYMVSHYAATYPNRWPRISSLADGIKMWLPAFLGVALSVSILLRRRWQSAEKNVASPDSAAAGVMFFPLYYALGCAALFHNDYAIVGHLWLAWPGLALGALLNRGGMRAALAIAIAPALWAAATGFWSLAREERTWRAQPIALPNGQSLWFRPAEAKRFGQLRAALGTATPPMPSRRLAVFLGGGGIHHFFGTQRVGRHWWFLPEFVRPWETAAVQQAVLSHEMILVVDVGQLPTAPIAPGVLPLWIPLPTAMKYQLQPHLRNPRHIEGLGELVQVTP